VCGCGSSGRGVSDPDPRRSLKIVLKE